MNETTEKLKLFGTRANRISTEEMIIVYNEVYNQLNNIFLKIQLSKFLPDKKDHGDIDIVIQKNENQHPSEYIYRALSNNVIDENFNGPIYSILYNSPIINKSVHIDFICSSYQEFDTNLMYLDYNDFSGVLGVLARKLHFSYGCTGFYKIYVDKRSGQYNYIKLFDNLWDGLRVLGYSGVLNKYLEIKNIDDTVEFIASSPFFDSSYYAEDAILNRSDRKRLRSHRTTASNIRKKLYNLQKQRNLQFEEDSFFKLFYQHHYSEYELKCQQIESFAHRKRKYDGNWIMKEFNLKPGPVIKNIQDHLYQTYNNQIDDQSEDIIKEKITNYLNFI